MNAAAALMPADCWPVVKRKLGTDRVQIAVSTPRSCCILIPDWKRNTTTRRYVRLIGPPISLVRLPTHWRAPSGPGFKAATASRPGQDGPVNAVRAGAF